MLEPNVMTKNKIDAVIIIEGGAIQDIIGSCDMRIVVVDRDVEDVGEEGVAEWTLPPEALDAELAADIQAHYDDTIEETATDGTQPAS